MAKRRSEGGIMSPYTCLNALKLTAVYDGVGNRLGASVRLLWHVAPNVVTLLVSLSFPRHLAVAAVVVLAHGCIMLSSLQAVSPRPGGALRDSASDVQHCLVRD